MHTGGLTGSWNSSARSEASFHSTTGKRTLVASAEQGRNREEPRNKWFGQLLGTSPQIPLSGPASHKQRAPRSHPSASSWRRLWSGKPRSQISREPSLTLGTKYLPKVGPAARRSKANKEASLVEGKACFIPKASNREGRAVSCPKTDSPH